LLDLQTFRKWWHFADLRFADPIFFFICELKTSASPQISTFSPYKNLAYTVQQCSYSKYKVKNRFKKTTFRTVLRQSCAVVPYFVEICGFAICGLIMRICGFSDWHTQEI
jgi:hypothetical protein